MKKRIALFIFTILILFSCDTGGGTTNNTDENSTENFLLTSPTETSLQADRFITLKGRILATTGPESYYLVIVSKNTDEDRYFLRGTFDQKIWMRYGAGTYTIEICRVPRVVEHDLGFISSYSHSLPAVVSLQVENTNPEIGSAIYPSFNIQSDASEILAISQSFTGSTNQEIIKEAHDWVVLNLQDDRAYRESGYDNDLRPLQDALSVLDRRAGVCEGYSWLYIALLRSRSIPAVYVSGIAGSSNSNHGWVKAFNGTEWRYIDPTWDDPIWGDSGHSDYPDGTNLRHTYFWQESLDLHTIREEHSY